MNTVRVVAADLAAASNWSTRLGAMREAMVPLLVPGIPADGGADARTAHGAFRALPLVRVEGGGVFAMVSLTSDVPTYQSRCRRAHATRATARAPHSTPEINLMDHIGG